MMPSFGDSIESLFIDATAMNTSCAVRLLFSPLETPSTIAISSSDLFFLPDEPGRTVVLVVVVRSRARPASSAARCNTVISGIQIFKKGQPKGHMMSKRVSFSFPAGNPGRVDLSSVTRRCSGSSRWDRVRLVWEMLYRNPLAVSVVPTGRSSSRTGRLFHAQRIGRLITGRPGGYVRHVDAGRNEVEIGEELRIDCQRVTSSLAFPAGPT